MLKQRIFTFGCSFTCYSWPTWADIILYDNKGYNFGRPGAGYDYILYSILEADRKLKFRPDDIIIVMLTQPIRFDVLLRGDSELYWITHGNAISSVYSNYNNELFCVDGLLFKAYNNILLINEYLQSRKLNYIFGSLSDLFNTPEGLNNSILDDNNIIDETRKLIDYVRKKVEIKLTTFDNYLSRDGKPWSETKVFDSFVDGHPRPNTYFNWVNDVLLKHISIEVKAQIQDIQSIEKMIDDAKYPIELNKIRNFFPKFFEHRFESGFYNVIDNNKYI